MTDHNPMQQFQKWFYEADELYNEREPNAMSLTTIGTDDYPKSRIVLLKKYTWEGFIFYTNYNSEKGMAIGANPNVTILFNWVNSQRMIQVSGTASKIPVAMSEAYFDLRPRGSQLSAWVSNQSSVVSSRQALEEALKIQERRFESQAISMPEYWGGYLIKPREFHFHERPVSTSREESIYKLHRDYIWSKKKIIHIISE